MTSKDVSSKLIDDITEFASKQKISRVEFWGQTKISSLLHKNREILNQYFHAEKHIIDYFDVKLRRWSEQLKSESDPIKSLLLTQNIVLLIVIHEAFTKSSKSNRKALKKIDKERERIEIASEATKRKIEKHKKLLPKLNKYHIYNLKAVRKEFSKIALKEKLNYGFLIDDVIKETDEAERNQIIQYAALREIDEETAKEMIEMNWEFYWKMFAIHFFENHREHISRSYRTFFNKSRRVCPKCRNRYSQAKSVGPSFITSLGKYMVFSTPYFVCYDCKTLELGKFETFTYNSISPESLGEDQRGQ